MLEATPHFEALIERIQREVACLKGDDSLQARAAMNHARMSLGHLAQARDQFSICRSIVLLMTADTEKTPAEPAELCGA